MKCPRDGIEYTATPLEMKEPFERLPLLCIGTGIQGYKGRCQVFTNAYLSSLLLVENTLILIKVCHSKEMTIWEETAFNSTNLLRKTYSGLGSLWIVGQKEAINSWLGNSFYGICLHRDNYQNKYGQTIGFYRFASLLSVQAPCINEQVAPCATHESRVSRDCNKLSPPKKCATLHLPHCESRHNGENNW